ncbi:MAG: hypothetical protein J5840_06930 [Lachnospiraceae bacterium]|nr:hypothetical protein [Lachnospiraceae bacterium]
MLYELIPVLLGIIVVVLGLIMAIFPRASTRKDLRDNPKAVAKNRLSGFIMIVLGILIVIFRIILFAR